MSEGVRSYQRVDAGEDARATAHFNALPSSVTHVLRAPGQALDPLVRSEVEHSLGHDFSRVRIHADSVAAASAEALRAEAWSFGPHVAFSAGRYEPGTPAGMRLLRHELAHVARSGAATSAPVGIGAHDDAEERLATTAEAGRTVPRKCSPSEVVIRRQPRSGAAANPTMGSGTVRAATPEERREFARDALAFIRSQGQSFALQLRRDLGDILDHLHTSTENALAAVAGDPAAATIAGDVRDAYSSAVLEVLRSRTRSQAGAVRPPPTMQELYEEHRDEILPFALPRADVDSAAGELTAELEAPLPAKPTRAQRTRHAAIESARQRLRVVTAPITIGIEDLFSTRGGTTTVSLPANTSARFSSTVPAAVQRGLTNVAGSLVETSALAPNTTVMLSLDLTPHGGGYDAYRFTRLDLGALGGEVLIERQGAIGVEGLRTEQRQQLQERFDRVGFRRGSGFRGEEFDQVLIGLAEIPETQLSALGALRFERQTQDATRADAAAHYDQMAHAVRVFDNAFSGGLTRSGRAGHVIRFAAASVVHEVGHAQDLSALRTSATTTTQAQQALLAEFGTGNSSYSIPASRAPERARFDVLNRALASAQAAERAARSRSGARWTTGNPSEVEDDLVSGAAQPAFRQAVLRDGGSAGRQMPTTYPNPESIWQEYFAESFALYQSSPDLLRRMRPNVYRFMVRAFPRSP